MLMKIFLFLKEKLNENDYAEATTLIANYVANRHCMDSEYTKQLRGKIRAKHTIVRKRRLVLCKNKQYQRIANRFLLLTTIYIVVQIVRIFI